MLVRLLYAGRVSDSTAVTAHQPHRQLHEIVQVDDVCRGGERLSWCSMIFTKTPMSRDALIYPRLRHQ